ncbi:MAG: TPM domain-containing protein [Sphingomonadaceae bacterium]
MDLTAEDRARVAAAVTEAEGRTDGEVMVVAAESSDAYHDVALHWSVLAMLLAIAIYASFPDFYMGMVDRLVGGWRHVWTPRELLTSVLFAAAAKFLGTRLILAWRPLRMALTPGSTKSRRVRRRAIALFKAGIEHRTATRTGVLLYLSLAEHRAEIVADAAIHAKVPPERWGVAMAGLVDALKDGRSADAMISAIAQIGAILEETFPRTGRDPDELPDRLIEL